jgi:mRNA-degrading endonuclease YafQ of YafQ-DinJ toxin-antitoxin module
MTDIDKFSEKAETLIEKIKNLNFKFTDHELETDAQDAKDEAVAAIENLIELATQEAEGREESEREAV